MKYYKKLTLSILSLLSLNVMADNKIETNSPLRIATFNVSMEALNYAKRIEGKPVKVTGSELISALKSDHQQIKNIAEIIQRINPDILLLNYLY